MDKDVSEEMLLGLPDLYRMGQGVGVSLMVKIFLTSNFKAVQLK